MIIIYSSNNTINCTSLADVRHELLSLSGKIKVQFVNETCYGCLDISDLNMIDELVIDGNNNSRICGARHLELDFIRHNDYIVKANIGKGLDFERLNFMGRTMIMSRYPNYNASKPLGGGATLRELNDRAVNWQHPETGYIRGLHNHEWGGNSYKVQGYAKGALTTKWIGDNNRGDKTNYAICENIFEELDAPDEWYYNKSDGTLYIYYDGDIQNKMSVDIYDNIRLLTIINNNTPIIIKNIAFIDSERSIFKSEWQRYLRSDWAFNTNAAVYIENSENITFQNCTFDNIGATCVLFKDYNSNIELTECEFKDSLSNGILILGNPDSTYSNSAWDSDNHLLECNIDSPLGTKTDNYPRNIRVNYCYFNNLGIEDKQSSAICISLAHMISIDHCTIHHLPRAGINICENAFGGHTISNCDIFDCVRETNDHGPFNSWGRDRFWSAKGYDTNGKYGCAVKPYALLDMLDGNSIIHNRIVGNGKGFGIDLDDGSTNYTIKDNLCINIGIKLREGFYRHVTNNYIINAPIDLHATYAGNDDIITNNLIFSDHPIRLAILNKGFTTRFENNYILNSAKKYLKNKVAVKYNNYLFDCNLDQIFLQTHNLPNMRKISVDDFGKPCCPTPSLQPLSNSSKSNTIQNRYGKFAALDDTLRSMSGSSSYEGIYIVKLNLLSALKRRFGLINGDVLLIANETILISPQTSDFNSIANCDHITIMRNQQQLIIKVKVK